MAECQPSLIGLPAPVIFAKPDGRSREPDVGKSTTILDATTIYAMQAWDVMEGVSDDANSLLAKAQLAVLREAAMQPVDSLPRYAQVVTESYRNSLIELWRSLSPKYLAFGKAASDALPRFLGRAYPAGAMRGERALDAIDAILGLPKLPTPFTPDDLKENEDSDWGVFLALWLLMQEWDIQLLLTQFTLFGMTLDLQWSVFIQRQYLQLLAAVSSAAAGAVTDVTSDASGLSGSAEAAVRRAVADEIRRRVAGGAGVPTVSTSGQPAAQVALRGMVQTQVWGILNEVISRSIQRNRRLFGAEQWVAILDQKTCKRCQRLHGQVFRLTDPAGLSTAPDCPLHAFCRCVLVPVPTVRSSEGQESLILPDFGEWFSRLPIRTRSQLAGPHEGRRFRSFAEFLNVVPRQDRKLAS